MRAIWPECIVLTQPNGHALYGTIAAASFLGRSARYDVAVGDLTIRLVGPAEQVVPPGTAVGLSFPASSAVAISQGTRPSHR